MSDVEYIQIFSDNGNWLDLNYEEIRRKYPNKFIAIKNKRIIAESDDIDKLIKKLISMKEDLNKVLIEFIPGKDTEFIL